MRALQLERDFQKRAEEAASQQDDDEEGNDVENESTSQRVQGLIRSATAQDQQRNHQPAPSINRINAMNQSVRPTLPPHSVGNQMHMHSNMSPSVQAVPTNQHNSYDTCNANGLANLNQTVNQQAAELKRRQAEFDESQRRRQEEESIRLQQHQHQQQMQYQSNMRNQQQIHPGMLRLDNLVIEESNPSS